eukprot:TRINITY_DN67143_c0_g1_i1.p1 TRINITY_DN67143_c0_g1~~TRINITY_DN67143_c0_g1_i1.p1  ORF type:complete len:312 (+),score=114.92 TRINITY_DN67143_c0_g1_i1:67-936(+)
MGRSVLLLACCGALLHDARCGAPRDMPADLKAAYTMDGKIPIGEYYVDDTGEDGEGTHYKYSAKYVKGFVDAAERVKASGADVKRDNKRMWLVAALKEHPFAAGGRGVVYGSIEPWYEALALAHGAVSVTTVEYNKLSYDWPGMSTVTVAECTAEPEKCSNFDFGISMSSFDHDGLGRYGDPLDPDGDIKAMQTTLKQLRPGGLLYLTLPIGPDVVVWNLHRRYGNIRLPRMLEGWEVVAKIPWNEERLTEERSFTNTYEPVFVLRKPVGDGKGDSQEEREKDGGVSEL